MCSWDDISCEDDLLDQCESKMKVVRAPDRPILSFGVQRIDVKATTQAVEYRCSRCDPPLGITGLHARLSNPGRVRKPRPVAGVLWARRFCSWE